MDFQIILLALLCCGFSTGVPHKANTGNYEKLKILQRNFDKIYSKLEHTKVDLHETNARVVGLHLMNDKLKSQVDLIESGVQATADTGIKHSAFLALNTQGCTVSAGEVIPFNQVSYNEAPKMFGFDSLTSFYRCPYNGTYMFMTNVVSQNSAEGPMTMEPVTIGISIMKNSINVVSSQVTTPHSGYGSSQVMSAAGVTSCGPGDEVGVVMSYCGSSSWSRGCAIAGGYSGPTHFTGFRIY